MEMTFNQAAITKLTPHLAPDKRLLLTFEDGVGPYSQHAMIHMQVQFTLNVIPESDPATDYDVDVTSNLGPVGIKGYSQEDLDAHLILKYDPRMSIFTLSGDGGDIDDNVGFIDFTES